MREIFDSLWSKSIQSHSSEFDAIKSIYCDILTDKGQEVTNETLAKTIIHMGISRHINGMFNLINVISHFRDEDTHIKSRLFECAISSNLKIHELPALRDIDDKTTLLVKNWCDERKFFSSQISHQISQSSQTPSMTIADSIVPQILDKMAKCSNECKSNIKTQAVLTLISGIC